MASDPWSPARTAPGPLAKARQPQGCSGKNLAGRRAAQVKAKIAEGLSPKDAERQVVAALVAKAQGHVRSRLAMGLGLIEADQARKALIGCG